MPAPKIINHVTRAADAAAARAAAAALLPPPMMEDAARVISGWAGYAETPLRSLAGAAERHRLRAVYYKDEAPRFGLNSFKALGGAYALQHLLARHAAAGGSDEDFIAATATDGNHGRSVAWGAQRSGCRAKIFLHQHVSEERAAAIAQYGADIIRIRGNYDDSVHACSEQARRNSWQIISDTSWPGYTDTPRLVMAGYTVLMRETLRQLDGARLTHIILQAGVGAFAAAMIAAALPQLRALPRIIIVESEHAACLQKSAAAGCLTSAPVTRETVMAGLSCGDPSPLAWPLIAAAASDFVSIADDDIGDIMRQLGQAGVIAGECAAAGPALIAAADDQQREALGLDDNSVVLMFGSEGATDAESYRRLTGAAR